MRSGRASVPVLEPSRWETPLEVVNAVSEPVRVQVRPFSIDSSACPQVEVGYNNGNRNQL